MPPLNLRQQRFIAAYIRDGNATQAAIAAGYSPPTAGQVGSRLLKNVQIEEAIAEAMTKAAEAINLTAEEVLRELACVAFADIGNAVHWGPDGVVLVASTELDDDTRRAVASVSETTTKGGGSRRIKMHDKVAALDKLARYLGAEPNRLSTLVVGGSGVGGEAPPTTCEIS